LGDHSYIDHSRKANQEERRRGNRKKNKNRTDVINRHNTKTSARKEECEGEGKVSEHLSKKGQGTWQNGGGVGTCRHEDHIYSGGGRKAKGEKTWKETDHEYHSANSALVTEILRM